MRTTQSRQLTVSVKAATQRKAPAKAVKGAKAKSAAAPGFGGPDRTKWLPNVEAPEWLDGSLPGDAGFDPLGLGKPTEYYQFDLDALDQNLPKNRAGGLLGKLKPAPVEVKEDALVPYTEVFDINRFRECELIHGRWAMLATLGAVVAELNTGVSWLDAGKYELENGSSYASLPLPFDLTQLVIIQTILMAGIEVLRNKELDVEKRCYPGGAFDPLNLASEPGSEQTFRLRVAEIKHSRLAMVAFFGYAAAAPKNGSLLGALESVFNK